MGEIGIGSLGSLLPELILLIGGLLILLLDIGQAGNEDEPPRARVPDGFGTVPDRGSSRRDLSSRYGTVHRVRHGCAGSVRRIPEDDGYRGHDSGGGRRRQLYEPAHQSHGEFWSLFLFVTLAMTHCREREQPAAAVSCPSRRCRSPATFWPASCVRTSAAPRPA